MNRTKLGKEKGKNIPGTGSSKCKSPEKEENGAHSRIGREANRLQERQWSRMCAKEENHARSVGHSGDLCLYSKILGSFVGLWKHYCGAG